MFIFDNNICAVYKRVISLFHRFNQKKKKFQARTSSFFVCNSIFSCQKAIAEKQILNWIWLVLSGKTSNMSI